MTETQARLIINEWNVKVNVFITRELPKILKDKYNIKPNKNGLYPIKANFICYEEKRLRDFYKKGMEILREIKKQGYDVRMNMQDNTLVYYGIL